jgi:hypothetical protein
MIGGKRAENGEQRAAGGGEKAKTTRINYLGRRERRAEDREQWEEGEIMKRQGTMTGIP